MGNNSTYDKSETNHNKTLQMAQDKTTVIDENQIYVYFGTCCLQDIDCANFKVHAIFVSFFSTL